MLIKYIKTGERQTTIAEIRNGPVKGLKLSEEIN